MENSQSKQLMSSSKASDLEPNIKKPFKSPITIVAIVSVAIVLSELLIMILLPVLPVAKSSIRNIIDPILLILFISPILYYFIFRPFMKYIKVNDQARERLTRNEERLKSFITIQSHKAESVHDLLGFAFKEAMKLTKSKVGYVYFYDEKKEEIFLDDPSEDVKIEYKSYKHKDYSNLGKSHVLNEIVRKRKSIILNDIHDNYFLEKDNSGNYVELYRFLAIPIISNGKIRAIIGVGNRDDDYVDYDLIQFKLLMNSVWKNVEHLEAAKTLKNLRVKTEHYLELANIMFLAFDIKGNVTYINKKGCDILGYHEEEIIGQNWINNFIPPEEREKILDVFYSITNANSGLFDHFENHILCKNGSVKLIAWHNTKIKDENGKIKEVLSAGEDITYRKEMENDLRESELQFRSIFENSPIGFYRTHPDGKILMANTAFVKILGFDSFEDLKSFNLREVAENHQYPRNEFLSLMKQKGQLVGYETFQIKKDGKPLYLRENAHIVYDDNSNVKYYEGTIEDITDKKMAELALKESEERYFTLFQQSNDGIFIHDLEGNIIDVNEKVLNMFGWDKDVILRKNVKELHPEDMLDKSKVAFEKIMKYGSVQFEIAFIKRDGSLFIADVSSKIIDIQGNKMVQAIVRDITEKKKAQIALKESEEKYSALFQQSHDGIFIHDLSGNILDVNRKVIEMLGYGREELLGMNISDLHPQEMLEIADKAMKKIKDEGLLQFEIDFLAKNGELFNAEVSSKIIEIGGQKIVQGIVRDITERKRAEDERKKLEAQLLQAQKMEAIGRLAGGIAHDFNNMLNVIIGFAELSIEDIDENDPLRENLSEILSAAKRSANLTRQLLAFARKQTIQPRVINLNEIINKSYMMLRRLVGEDIEIKFNKAKKLWNVKIDPMQIDQILANLAVNARDAIRDVGTIIIETSNIYISRQFCNLHAGFKPGKYVQITFSDTGEGIDNEILKHVFEPFYTTKKEGYGTGLGLSTVYGIVKQNNGFIDIYSEKGEGTTFKIYFPKFDKVVEREEPKKSVMKVGGKGTILVVEDEERILKLIKTVLERFGYNVLSAKNPSGAIAIGESEEKFDLLITDVILPGMNGKEMVEKIVSMRPDLKVIYMSGYTENIILHKGVLEKGVEFIQKPFLPHELLAKVRNVFSE